MANLCRRFDPTQQKGHSMTHRWYQIVAWVGVLLGILVGSSQAAPQSQLVEGFETPANLQTTGPEPRSIRRPSRVTQGNHALQLAPGGGVKLTLVGKDLQQMAWLRIDTYVEAPREQLVEIRLRAGEKSGHLRAVVKAQADTLSVPLDWLSRQVGLDWPEAGVILEIQNVDAAGLILDNVRLEALAAPPAGMVLLDFGPEDQLCWPGFARADHTHPAINWSGQIRPMSRSMGYPDPLGQDWIGPRPRPGVEETFSVVWNDPADAVGWLWMTHYATLGGAQGDTWYLRQGRRTLAGRRLSTRQMLGPEGLLEGYGGPWTGQWFARTYAKHFVHLQPLSLEAGANRFQMKNGQLAALAVVPAAQKRPGQAYVETIQKQLETFRRQFIAGRRQQWRCQLPPTEDEKRAGLIVLSPTGEKVTDPGWQPDQTDRVAKILTLAARGGKTILPLAVVPLKDQALLRGQLLPLRSETGQVLPMRGRSRIHFLDTVPVVESPIIRTQPWIVSQGPRGIEARQIVPIFLEIDIPSSAKAGTYSGALRILGSGGMANVELTLDVVDIACDPVEPVVVALQTDVRRLLPALYGQVSGPAIRSSNERLLQQVLEEGFTSAVLASPGVQTSGRGYLRMLAQDGLAPAVSSYQGPVFARIDAVFGQLGRNKVPLNSEVYRKQTAEAAELIGKTFKGLRVDRGYALTDAWRPAEMPALQSRGQYIRGGRMPPAALTYASRIKDLDPAGRNAVFQTFSALVLLPNTDGVRSLFQAFLATGPDREVFCNVVDVDRYRCGFFPAAAGAQGILVRDVVGSQGPYKGFGLQRSAVMALEPNGRFAPTLLSIRLRQGVADLALVMRCRKLLAKADAAKVDAEVLRTVLAEIEALGDRAVRYEDSGHPDAVRPERLDEFRARLLQAAGAISEALGR